MRKLALLFLGVLAIGFVAGCSKTGNTVTNQDVKDWQNEGLAEGETADQAHEDGR